MVTAPSASRRLALLICGGVASLCPPSPGGAHAAAPAFELRLPLQSWGGLSGDTGDAPEGLFLQAFLSAGVEVGLAEVAYLTAFGGVLLKESSENAHVWNNAVEVRGGGGVRFPIPAFDTLIPGAWSSVLLSVRQEELRYSAPETVASGRRVWAGELQLGLDWARLRSDGAPAGRLPLGLPLQLAIEAGHAQGQREEGVLLQGLVEQGFDVGQIGGARLGPVVAVAFKRSDRQEEFWNNHVDLRVGLRLRYDANPFGHLYGSLFAELRAESRVYLSGARSDEWRALLYAGWWFGGALASMRP